MAVTMVSGLSSLIEPMLRKGIRFLQTTTMAKALPLRRPSKKCSSKLLISSTFVVFEQSTGNIRQFENTAKPFLSNQGGEKVMKHTTWIGKVDSSQILSTIMGTWSLELCDNNTFTDKSFSQALVEILQNLPYHRLVPKPSRVMITLLLRSFSPCSLIITCIYHNLL